MEHDSASASEWRRHGGRVASARAAFPQAPTPWLDLSTGINPHSWDAARAGPIDWAALPDPDACAALEAAAAAYFGVAADHVCALPGTETGLRLLDTLNPPQPVRHVAPAYPTHAEAIAGSIAIPAERLVDEAAYGGTILLANPNNPDGRIVAPAHLLDAAALLGAAGGGLVVDEAFADAVPETSILPHLPAGAPVIVLRSFGKFFGLAGVRLGFAVASPARLDGFRQRLGGWPVSAAAIAIGTAAYSDAAWIAAARHRLVDDAAALDALLARHGLVAFGDCPLFRLVDTADAPAIFGRLLRHGILARPFDYAPRWLRFGLPADAEALDRLDRALADD